MTFLTAAILGVVQGLTEFLPISSTAHLLLGGRLLGYEDPGGVFTTMIQLGSILAVMWLYRAKILEVALGLPREFEARRFTMMLLAAFVPAAVAGFLLGDYVQDDLYMRPGVIAAAFIVGGLVMLAVEHIRPEATVTSAARTPVAKALGIGLSQTLALVPGVSRSGATVVGGLLMGLDRAAAAEFSFFLAMPTMAAAFVYEILKARDQLDVDRAAEIGVGFLFAFLAALVVVRPFLRFVARSGFALFAYYRIVVGLAILAASAAGWL